MREDANKVKKRILYVEDHKAFGEMVSKLLSDYEVLLVSCVKDGLERAKQEKFEIYLLDLNLPDGDGLELCREIRTFDAETPVLFLTASSDLHASDVVEVRAQGALTKNDAGFAKHLRLRVSQLLDGNAAPQD